MGAIASFALPLLLLAGLGTRGFPFFPPGPAGGGLLAGVVSSFVVLGFVFGVVGALFSPTLPPATAKELSTPSSWRPDVCARSNVAGMLAGIGAFLCYTSPRNRRR